MFKHRKSADDFAEEIKAHLELEADVLKCEGLSEDEARRRAKVEFGNVPAAQERFYLESRIVWLDNLMRDLKYAIRQLVKNPGFAATAILVLAIGVGASVAIFAFVDAVLIKPLPYESPSRLVNLFESNQTGVVARMGVKSARLGQITERLPLPCRTSTTLRAATISPR